MEEAEGTSEVAITETPTEETPSIPVVAAPRIELGDIVLYSEGVKMETAAIVLGNTDDPQTGEQLLHLRV